MKTPDITLAQIVGLVAAVAAMAAAFGLDLTQQQQDAITNLVTVAVPLLFAADAFIRHGRAKVAAAQAVAPAPTVVDKADVPQQLLPLSVQEEILRVSQGFGGAAQVPASRARGKAGE